MSDNLPFFLKEEPMKNNDKVVLSAFNAGNGSFVDEDDDIMIYKEPSTVNVDNNQLYDDVINFVNNQKEDIHIGMEYFKITDEED